MREAILSLKEKAADHKSEVRLFYYCGHGGRDLNGQTTRSAGNYILDEAGDKLYCNDIVAWLKVKKLLFLYFLNKFNKILIFRRVTQIF